MNISMKITSAVAASLFSLSGFALTGDEVKAEKNNIDAQYKSAMAQCKTQNGNAKDVCEKQAKGNEKVARAELEARADPTESRQYKARLARADADYEVAKERCDDQSGNAKDVCKKDAQAAHVKAKEAAKVMRAEADPAGATPQRRAADVSEVRKEAAEETRDAQYKAAKERCDALSGAAKDTCVNDAKTRFAQ
ncbi:hypothetical protein H9K76_01380 [Diaphorobacter ruginosibacter]|uniref:Cell envelope biogenesis protein TolA n=1 Tax=Diaphorobacter ruginosibacter TaxID=1715720 RepID=A0A7G9RPQ6_9BURK|nr:hypothetical protein H9K76_01380 [Diaphorobacter ruginosibacter]